MKVEQKGKDFEPIVIMLETEDEAKAMWCVLFAMDNIHVERCAEKKVITFEALSMCKMFEAFHKVYDPKDC